MVIFSFDIISVQPYSYKVTRICQSWWCNIWLSKHVWGIVEPNHWMQTKMMLIWNNKYLLCCVRHWKEKSFQLTFFFTKENQFSFFFFTLSTVRLTPVTKAKSSVIFRHVASFWLLVAPGRTLPSASKHKC